MNFVFFCFSVADKNITGKFPICSPFPTLAPLPGLGAQPPSLRHFLKYFFPIFEKKIFFESGEKPVVCPECDKKFEPMAAEIGRRWRIQRMSRMSKWQDLDTDLRITLLTWYHWTIGQ